MKTRVLHIIKSLGRGGAEMLLPETLKSHDQSKFEFQYIYFLPWKNQMVEALEKAGGKVTCISASNNAAMIARIPALIEYIKKNEIDIIHAHLPWAGVVARIAGRIADVPVIYTEHNKQERYHFATRWMNLLTIGYSRRVIAVSSDVAESVRRFKPRLKTTLDVILNGVDPTQFKRDKSKGDKFREHAGIPIDAVVVGTVAVFRFQKRLDVWLQVAQKINRVFPEVRFVIVGDGPLRERIKMVASELGLNDVVHFAGLQTDVRPFLSAFDIFMMSSIFEGLPVAMLEAMASKCCIVATKAGGIKEVITDRLDGLLCDVDDPMLLFDLSRQVIQNAELRAMLAENACSKIETTFSIVSMIRKLEQVYSNEARRSPKKRMI